MFAIQLRHYTVAAAKRDLLLAMLESSARTLEGPGALLGTFRDLDDDRGLVSLQGLDELALRRTGLDGLDQQAIAATQARLERTVLLRPGWEDSGLPPAVEHPSARAGELLGVIELGILRFAAPVDVIDLMYFCDEVAPLIQSARGSMLACLVEQPTALEPAGEHGDVLVWLASFPERSASMPAITTAGWISEALQAWPGLGATPQLLRLRPTERSAINPASSSGFRPIYLVPRSARPHDAPAGTERAIGSTQIGWLRLPTLLRRRRRAG